MVKYDYLQFRTESQFIEIDRNMFDIVPAEQNQHQHETLKLNRKVRNAISKRISIPLDRIKVSITGPYLSLSITAKLLGRDYPELISAQTINTCFRNLVNYGILVDIDINNILDQSKVTVVEVTNDFIINDRPFENDYKVFAQALFNPYQWLHSIWDNGFGLKKAVEEDKELIVLYNKSVEMQLKKNRKFIEAYKLHDAYKNPGSMRAEVRLLSAQAVRRNFRGNDVSHIIHCPVNPLTELMEKVFVNTNQIKPIKSITKPDHKRYVFASKYRNDPRSIADAIDRDIALKHNRSRKYREIMGTVMGINFNHSNRSLAILREIIQINSERFN